MSASEGIANFSAVVGAVVPIVGLFLVWMGLNTWKDQSIWQADNDLARRFLVTAYRYRNSLYSVRSPDISDSEMALDNPETNISSDELHDRGIIEAYIRRTECHSPTRSDLDALLVEAEAVWGNELSRLVKDMYDLEHELFLYIRRYLDANHRGETPRALWYQKILSEMPDILEDTMNEKDIFRIGFVAKLNAVEDYLRRKLGRST